MQKSRKHSGLVVVVNVVSIGGGIDAIFKALSTILNRFRH